MIRPDLPPWLRLMRPGQWPKNLLVFLPCLASHRLEPVVLAQTIGAFVTLCLASSAIYALNDARDAPHDRLHPRKALRPVAAGEISSPVALGLSAALAAAALALAAVQGAGLVAGVALYLALATAYALLLKRRAVADLVVLALLYTLRVVTGGLASGIAPSAWLLAFCLLFFFALAALKRQAELVARNGAGPLPGRAYGPDDLVALAGMAIGAGHAAAVVLVLYLQSAEVRQAYGWELPLWGVCVIVLYWINRAVLLTGRGRMGDDPVAFALRDGVTWACLVLIAGLAVTAL